MFIYRTRRTRLTSIEKKSCMPAPASVFSRSRLLIFPDIAFENTRHVLLPCFHGRPRANSETQLTRKHMGRPKNLTKSRRSNLSKTATLQAFMEPPSEEKLFFLENVGKEGVWDCRQPLLGRPEHALKYN
jgi:hypothetical protein